MTYLIVQHKVSDYTTWRQAFESNESFRRSSGATGVKQVYQDIHDPNAVTVLLEWKDATSAQKFVSDPDLAKIMEQAGVIGKPSVASILSAA